MHTKHMIKMLIITGLVLGAIFGYQGFKSLMIKRYLGSNSAPIVSVSAMKASYQTWQPKLRASGSLEAVDGVEVTTEIGGLIKDVPFTSGSQVNKGDILVTLNADTDIAKLESLKAALVLAELTYKRDKNQFSAKAISKATLEADEADLKSKQAQVAEQAAIVAMKTIRAPLSGRVGIAGVNVGQYLNPGDKIVTLQALDQIYVHFNIPQKALAQIAPEQAVQISVDTYPGKIFEGKITSIDPKVDPKTLTVLVEATFPNPNQELVPGMFASVEVLSGQPHQYITLPQTAVSFNPYGEIAFIIKETGKDDKGEPVFIVTQNFITVGETRGDQIAILKGIHPGDLIVTTGQHKLKNGSRVKINNSILPLNNAEPKPIDK
ncbi:MAG: efflux RND transporter periplasmic adaptor subunit [Alphaproteobacteria bacterium]|nr:efflux RND transporter periplasmic adaptor subunit [Alphaproteobacteria bacterium]